MEANLITPSNRETSLILRGIQKKFGKKIVHQGVDLTLYKGEILGLFGGSGTGKSVILRSIIGLEKPNAGEIIFEGINICKLKEEELIEIRKKIAYVFQNGALFDSMSVEQNLAYPLEAHTKYSPEEIHVRVDAMLDLLDMKGANDLLPAELSGGMQKRAGIGRALILGPEIILFDEPTAGLDPVNTKRVLANIRKLKSRGCTAIFVTHDIPSAFEICDRIAILYQGKIHFVGTVDEIRASNDPVVQPFISEDYEKGH